jgi:hypothetical protein
MTVLPLELRDERVASVAVTRALAFDPAAREGVFDTCLRDLQRERGGKGDLIVTLVPQGFGPRLVEHVNATVRKALADAR